MIMWFADGFVIARFAHLKLTKRETQHEQAVRTKRKQASALWATAPFLYRQEDIAWYT